MYVLTVAVITTIMDTMNEKLQTGIQDPPVRRRTTEALLGILRTAALLDHELNEVLRPYGLTQTQYNVLHILQRSGDVELCGREIADRLVSTVPDVPRLLDRMETMELIVRERSAEDRRYVTTRLSPKGRALLEEVAPELRKVEGARLGGLDEGTLERLIDGLEAVRRCP